MTQPAYANTLAEYRTQHNGALIGILSDIANSSINKDEFYNRTIFNHLSLVLMAGLTPDPTDWTQQYRAILELIKINASASRFSGIATMPTQDNFVVSIPDVSSLSSGMSLLVYFPSPNTTTSPTINVSSIGMKAIKNKFGAAIKKYEIEQMWVHLIYAGGEFIATNTRDTFGIGMLVMGSGLMSDRDLILANGATISRSGDYARLWDFVQSSGALAINAADKIANPAKYGIGNGSTTFELPDYRGEFIRAADLSRGIDAGRGIATNQSAEVLNHNHTLNSSTINVSSGSSGVVLTASGSGATTNYTGGENRPRNFASPVYVKFK
jgi:hypothetical protein